METRSRENWNTLKDQHMKVALFVSLAVAGSLFVPIPTHAQYAGGVVAYTTGAGFTPGYTTAAAALGAPSVTTPGLFGGPVDPFDPPFLPSQIVSIGAGGSITLQMSVPIIRDPSHAFGIDFMIFGNSGYVITNGDYSGGGVTDGSLFGVGTGATRVEVSQDGVSWYVLDPSRAPAVDGLFPTDGAGNPQVPVNPALSGADFAGLGLAGIRALYNGSAGGAGFDLAWAQDSHGVPVNLPSAGYVRIDVLSGTSEIDAVSAVPEPAVCALALAGVVFFRLRCRSS
jgi:hypothetical protein